MMVKCEALKYEWTARAIVGQLLKLSQLIWWIKDICNDDELHPTGVGPAGGTMLFIA